MLTYEQIMRLMKYYGEQLAIKVYNYNQFYNVMKMYHEVYGIKNVALDADSCLGCVYKVKTHSSVMNNTDVDYNIYPIIMYIEYLLPPFVRLNYTVDNIVIHYDFSEYLAEYGMRLIDFNLKDSIPFNRYDESKDVLIYKDLNMVTKYYDMYDNFNFMYYDENSNEIIVDKIIVDRNKDFRSNKGMAYEVRYGEDNDCMYVNFEFINNNKCNLSPKYMEFSSEETYFCVYTDDKEYDKYKELLTQRLKKDKLDALEEEINKLKENYKDVESKLLKL